MSNYKLINPYIEGTLVTTFTAPSQLDAACSAWETLSKYITNTVPKFAFTLKNVNDGTLSHFIVKESLRGGKSADYKIKELDLKLSKDTVKQFEKRLAMKGGKKHKKDKKDGDDEDDSSSSSSSSSSDEFSAIKLHKMYTKAQPITYWWYDPIVYEIESVYIPTFVAPLLPYIEVVTFNYYP
ncbi:hypothetical protein Klosneuvirus_1_190 [Klosneuvirus KNV1]|uniref:Uncharacterized protein n=1 Tax=Klosneuvirus KNV1 TaxID=1977640 RepID=A0A1V0SHZ2_9VIRU|nr:hypothetical protein Klosneuvirus_1_190 [Klosneuvirus KNV1]